MNGGVDELLRSIEADFAADYEERLRANAMVFRDFLVADTERMERVIEDNRRQLAEIEERWGL